MQPESRGDVALNILRYVVFGIFAWSAFVVCGSWLVRSRRIKPLSHGAKTIRMITDPFLRPVEHWIHRRGGNPQNAEWWLLGGTLAGGIVFLSLADWMATQLRVVALAGDRGAQGVVRVLVYYAGQAVIISLVVRVIGSWFGVGRYNRWMKLFYLLTDWIVEPLRKIIPPIGMIDITPIVAWFALQLILSWLMRIL